MATEAENRLRTELVKQFPGLHFNRLVHIHCEVSKEMGAESTHNSYLDTVTLGGSEHRINLDIAGEGKVIVAFADSGNPLPKAVQMLDLVMSDDGPPFVNVRFMLVETREIGQ